MRPETREWIAKAEADFAQQSAEKYLKGLLCENDISFPKTHDLNKLAALLPPERRCAPELADGIARLDRYSVEFRYPGSSATADLAAESAQDAREFCAWASRMFEIA